MTPRAPRPIFQTVAILGLGLIGGSLAEAITERGLARRVIGANRSADGVRTALRRKIIDHGTQNFIQAVATADLVILATSIASIPHILQIVAPALKKGAIVTDVGSTKSWIVTEGEEIVGRHAHFIGGHPMAGLHKQGVGAARADLLTGAKFFLTPTRHTSRPALQKLQRFVQGLGMRPVVISPETHDLLLAAVSHLPMVISAALVQVAAGTHAKKFRALDAAGPAFRDMTRIAAGSPA